MKPNILLIVADSFRYDCLGRSGRFDISTPNLDALAAQGVFFTHAYTPSPVCAPARQAMLSGRTADSIGALWNYDFIPTNTLCGDDRFYTDALHDKGYKNAFLGKWHSSATHKPVDFAFDTFIDYSELNNELREKFPDLKFENGWFGDKNELPLEFSHTHWLANKAADAIAGYAKNNDSFHMRVDFIDPHLPVRPCEPFAYMYDSDSIELWDSCGDPLINKPYSHSRQVFNWKLEDVGDEKWRRTVALYRGMISQLDDAVGIILRELKNSGLEEDTAVIFTSDHGDLCGGHGMMDKHYVLYEDITHVPLIISYPRGFSGALSCDGFVSNCLDLAPTIEELCELQPSGKRHGFSLLPLCRGETANMRRFEVSAGNGQQFGLVTVRCIVGEKWKYIWNAMDIDELYDLENDPGEKRNLINEPGDAPLAQLKKLLFEELKRRDDPFISGGWLDRQFR